MLRHVSHKHDSSRADAAFLCAYCPKTFVYQRSLDSHVAEKHWEIRAQNHGESIESHFHCDICEHYACQKAEDLCLHFKNVSRVYCF